MRNLLEKLENNEAVLLMYLADELDAQDRAEVQRMLQNDAALAQELKNLLSLQDFTGENLSQLASPGGRAVAADSRDADQAAKWFGREVARWHNRRLATAPTPAVSWHLPRWAYSAGVAAVLLVGIGIWWANRPAIPIGVVTDEMMEQRLSKSLADSDEADRAVALSASDHDDPFRFLTEAENR